MTSSVWFTRLVIRSFRNLAALELAPGPHLNVITGDNGQGKTSLLEALYVVATTRSFRTESLRDAIREGDDLATVIARVREDDQDREQRAVVGARTRRYLLDGNRPDRLAQYATRTPVVVFHPGDLALVAGAAALRRQLLDRVALYTDASSLYHRARYTQALRERQAALDARGPTAPDLPVFERLMADHGARWATARRSAAEHVAATLSPVFARVAPRDLTLYVEYLPGGTEEVELFARRLVETRPTDARRRSATFGPQRDDLDLALNGRSARKHASQGQQRILTLALKLAELDCIRAARQAQPVLLLDDVSSELDPARTGAVYELLRDTASQVFVTTTRSELLGSGPTSDRVEWVLDGGNLL